MKLLFLMTFVLFMVTNVDGVEQKCGRFADWDLFYDGRKPYYSCDINNANLTDEIELVTTNTELNERSNDDVTMVYYSSDGVVKFIPNSLYTIFINLEVLWIRSNNKFKTIKPEFFRNANKLKILVITENDIKILEANLFVNALNLEYIGFGQNKIESIHKFTFNGLKNLQEVSLHYNKISNLHPSTFSFLTKLNILDLDDNTCIDQRFEQSNQKVSEVEEAIGKSCAPGYNPEELAANEGAKKLAEQERIAAELKIDLEKTNLKVTELEDKLKDANELNQANQQNMNEMQEKSLIKFDESDKKHELVVKLIDELKKEIEDHKHYWEKSNNECVTNTNNVQQQLQRKSASLNECRKKVEEQNS